ncbi:hypothetical protein RvY_04825 [Ramazzottius varieornatus]|uniref:NEDD8-activating enzyme E1 catalytic subunit n=1 Tax=Ramazzottius varieornatus TaxID=947166 RepID=A0A1D1UZJ5_RAMVA|nr:hypothetical protein RvY_04825 [Ramazzottius varieornatus]
MAAATNGVNGSSDVERDIDAGEDDFQMGDFHGGSGGCLNKAVANLVTREGNRLTRPEFEPSKELLDFMQNNLNILIIGAGGLGCELLKDLALLGFRQLHVIDMDTIDLSNLNRQFLFRHSDIGKSKAECAARFINERIPQCNVQAYCNRIEEFDEEFYRRFPIIVCGLDSIQARRWTNGMIVIILSASLKVFSADLLQF